jgi:translation initiation factor 1
MQVDDGHATIGYRAMARLRPSDNVQQVYSTDSGRVPTERAKRPSRAGAGAPAQGGPPKDGVVRVSRTSAGRGGKTVTLVTGVPSSDVTEVAARLKKLCGSGGTVKDGVIEIQGDHRKKIAAHLGERFTTKLAGG